MRIKLVTVQCQNCGAQLHINPDDEQVQCPFCATMYTVRRAGSTVALKKKEPTQMGLIEPQPPLWGMHQVIAFNCVMIRSDVVKLCNTFIVLALDVGAAAFRCPTCGAIYIVAPLQETPVDGSPYSPSMEMKAGGQRIEAYDSAVVTMLQSDRKVMEAFLKAKVGSIRRYYEAGTY